MRFIECILLIVWMTNYLRDNGIYFPFDDIRMLMM